MVRGRIRRQGREARQESHKGIEKCIRDSSSGYVSRWSPLGGCGGCVDSGRRKFREGALAPCPNLRNSLPQTFPGSSRNSTEDREGLTRSCVTAALQRSNSGKLTGSLTGSHNCYPYAAARQPIACYLSHSSPFRFESIHTVLNSTLFT